MTNLVLKNDSHSSLLEKSLEFDSLELLLFEFFENFESEHTKKSYRSDLKGFFDYWMNVNGSLKHWSQVTRVHALQYKKFLTELNQSPKTINRKFSCLTSFFTFLWEKNCIAETPFTHIKRPKQEVLKPTQDLTDEEVLHVLEVAKNELSPMHAVVVYLLFTTGLRKSEIIHLKREDFSEQKGHTVVRLKTKGGKYLTKVIPVQCMEVIKKYLHWQKKFAVDVSEKDWLLLPSKNPVDGNLIRPLDPKSFDYIFKQAMLKAQIFKRVSPHSARATYIGSALDAGVDLYHVSRDVGHSSVKTTEEYNKRARSIEQSPVFSLPFLKVKDP
jgi:site-specific recombinase XerD